MNNSYKFKSFSVFQQCIIEQVNVQPIETPMEFFCPAKTSEITKIYYSFRQQRINLLKIEGQQKPKFIQNKVFAKNIKKKPGINCGHKYKRSSNNSHKKFISSLRRLLFQNITTEDKNQFQQKNKKYKSSRIYFFLILIYIKYKLKNDKMEQICEKFIKQVTDKIQIYKEEIIQTKNKNLKQFRDDQIIDLGYSISACSKFINGNIDQAVQILYKRQKTIVIKKFHFQNAIKVVQNTDKNFKSIQSREEQDENSIEEVKKILNKNNLEFSEHLPITSYYQNLI